MPHPTDPHPSIPQPAPLGPRCDAVHPQRRVRCTLPAHGPEIRHHAPVESHGSKIQSFTWGGA